METAKKPFFDEVRRQPLERKYPAWNFACPGKSLEAWNDGGRPHALDDAPLVAVNSAIGLVHDADVWLLTRPMSAIQDVLNDFGLIGEEIIKGGKYVVWTSKGSYRWMFQERLDDFPGVIFEQYPNRKKAMETGLLKFPTRSEWSEAGPLGGVAIAISKGGQHIRIFGQDMRGMGYAGIPAGPNTWRNDEDSEHMRRWQRERRVTDYATVDAANGGVLIQVAGLNWEPGQEEPIPEATGERVTATTKEETREYVTDEEYRKDPTRSNPTMKPHADTEENRSAVRAAEAKIAAQARAEDAEREAKVV